MDAMSTAKQYSVILFTNYSLNQTQNSLPYVSPVTEYRILCIPGTIMGSHEGPAPRAGPGRSLGGCRATPCRGMGCPHFSLFPNLWEKSTRIFPTNWACRAARKISCPQLDNSP